MFSMFPFVTMTVTKRFQMKRQTCCGKAQQDNRKTFSPDLGNEEIILRDYRIVSISKGTILVLGFLRKDVQRIVLSVLVSRQMENKCYKVPKRKKYF